MNPYSIFIHQIAKDQFDATGIGTFVTNPISLKAHIQSALDTYEFPENGQGFMHLPEEAFKCVVPGVARRTNNLKDYVLRSHRGQVSEYLNRDKVELPKLGGLAIIVYTEEAFLADKQVSDEAKQAFTSGGYTHAWITTLAMAGPRAPVGAWRFVANLAGGNLAYSMKTAIDLHEEAKAIEAYWSEWCTVASE